MGTSILSNITVTRRSITAELCGKLIDAAEQRARTIGMAIATAIVDDSGVLKAFRRMDGAPLVSVSTAQKKALTAVGFGLPTGEAWWEFAKDDPILREGMHGLDNFVLLGGGAALTHQDQIVGAIGVSGGHYKEDEKCMAAALELFEAICSAGN